MTHAIDTILSKESWLSTISTKEVFPDVGRLAGDAAMGAFWAIPGI